MDKCRAIKRNGEPCTLPVNGQQGFCWAHDPENREKRVRTASRGGRTKANKEVRALKRELRELIEKLEDGRLEPTPANSMIRAYGVIIEAIKLERSVYVEDDLAARIEDLKREGSGTS